MNRKGKNRNITSFNVLYSIATIIVLIIQTTLLIRQNRIIDRQNSLIIQQNKQIEAQTNLTESNRRSSLINLLGDIFNQVNTALNKNHNRILSEELIGEIVTVSQALKPYKLYENDRLLDNLYSPERAQLLLFLVRARLNQTTYNNIFYSSNFSYADIRNFDFTYLNVYLRNCNLKYSSFEGSKFYYGDLRYAKLEESNLEKADFYDTNLEGASLSGSNMKGTCLAKANLKDAKLKNVNLSYSDLRESNFNNTDLSNAILDSAIVDRLDWFEALRTNEVKGIGSLSIYYVDSVLYEKYPSTDSLVQITKVSKGNYFGKYFLIKKKNDKM